MTAHNVTQLHDLFNLTMFFSIQFDKFCKFSNGLCDAFLTIVTILWENISGENRSLVLVSDITWNSHRAFRSFPLSFCVATQQKKKRRCIYLLFMQFYPKIVRIGGYDYLLRKHYVCFFFCCWQSPSICHIDSHFITRHS